MYLNISMSTAVVLERESKEDYITSTKGPEDIFKGQKIDTTNEQSTSERSEH